MKETKEMPLLDVSNIKLPKYILDKIEEEYKEMKDGDGEYTSLDVAVVQYDVAVFGNEHIVKDKCIPIGITHAAIIFYTEDGSSYTFEWGNMIDNIGGGIEETDCYEYKAKGNIWKGGSPQSGEIRGITLRDIVEYSEKWKIVKKTAGQYPRNCRGYVDSILNGLLEERMINWKQYK